MHVMHLAEWWKAEKDQVLIQGVLESPFRLPSEKLLFCGIALLYTQSPQTRASTTVSSAGEFFELFLRVRTLMEGLLRYFLIGTLVYFNTVSIVSLSVSVSVCLSVLFKKS